MTNGTGQRRARSHEPLNGTTAHFFTTTCHPSARRAHPPGGPNQTLSSRREHPNFCVALTQVQKKQHNNKITPQKKQKKGGKHSLDRHPPR